MTISELDTEQKIKEAARKIFHEKGFDATKTRDIAQASGINLALLNYYFRSKKKLYDIIMLETLNSFFGSLLLILNDENTDFHQKLSRIVEHYIDSFSAKPDIPLFILSEAKNNSKEFLAKLNIAGKIAETLFVRQFAAAVQVGIMPQNIQPLHFLLNLAGMVVFPFVARPVLIGANVCNTADFKKLMQERKQLIPQWIAILLTKN